jgi:AsmA-like C-terminal region
VLVDADLELADVTGSAQGQTEDIRALRATGSLAGGGTLQIQLAPAGEMRRITVDSDQCGKLLEALGLYDNIKGGKLSVTAMIDDRASAYDGHGQIDLDDFRVVEAPLLARILSLGSLDGIAGLLRAEGIAFTHARVPFAFSGERIEVDGARAVGAIGLTADGGMDRSSGSVDVRGQVIPAYTLNSALGRLPFVGNLLVGGEGKGVFGIDYAVRGMRDEPKVSVNPLSALAPGVLRKMFIDPFTQQKPARTLTRAPE